MLTIVMWLLIAAVVLPLLYGAGRAIVCDRFIIKGNSMEPTLHSGEAVYVRKLIIGPRIYKHFRFGEEDTLSCFRLPGIRHLRVGDMAIYNYQYGWERGRIGFKINYVYAKRCIGIGGDTVSIRDCRYLNSRVGDVGVSERTQDELREMPDSLLLRRKSLKAGQFAGEQEQWTVKEFGPIVVPYRGMSVMLDSTALQHYGKLLEYETGREAERLPGSLYTFRQDYCFFAGDNVPNSRDSRYDGFVPENFVIGVFK